MLQQGSEQYVEGPWSWMWCQSQNSSSMWMG